MFKNNIYFLLPYGTSKELIIISKGTKIYEPARVAFHNEQIAL